MKFKNATEKEKHKEIQRRTTLLYGHQDLQKLINKSEDSIAVFKRFQNKPNIEDNSNSFSDK